MLQLSIPLILMAIDRFLLIDLPLFKKIRQSQNFLCNLVWSKYLKYYSSGKPEFIEGNVFRVLIPLGDQKGEGTNATINATVNDLIVHAFGKEINTKVRERLGWIVSFIQNEPGSRANAITEGVELSKSIVRRELTNLINNDVIEFVGAPKTGGYRLKNNSSKK